MHPQMDEEEKAMVAEATANGKQPPQGVAVRIEDDEEEEPMKIVKDYQRPVAR